jgi:hypothetical protein
VKYSSTYGLKFRRSQVASLSAVFGVHDQELIRQAMKATV